MDMDNDTGMGSVTAPLHTLVLSLLTTAAAALSIGGSGAIAGELLLRTAGLSDQLDALLCVLSVLELCMACFLVFGRSFIGGADVQRGGRPNGLLRTACRTQAFGIQFFAVAIFLWIAIMSLALLDSLKPGHAALSDAPSLGYTLRRLLPVLFLSGVLAILASGLDLYGDATLFCWVDGSKASLELAFLYAPLIASWLVCAASVVCTHRAMRQRLRDAQHRPRVLAEHSAASLISSSPADAVLGRTVRLLGVFLVCNLMGLVNRATNFVLEANGRTPFVFALYAAQAILFPLQGFGNALVYGRCLEWKRLVCGGHRAHPTRRAPLLSFRWTDRQLDAQLRGTLPDGGAARDLRRLPPPRPPPPPVAVDLTVHAATWNMGKAPPPTIEEVRAWLPTGKDLYAISVQECTALKEMTRVVGDAVGTGYRAHVRSIGSPLVGGFIAIIIFSRFELESEGHLLPLSVAAPAVRRGKKVLPTWLVQRASNKGAVGIAFRYYSTTIAFVGCHLASDSGGSSKIERRTRDARALLEGLELAYDKLGFALQHTCHHVVLLGDLNYRVRLAADEAIRCMADGDWARLHAADELGAAMAAGSVFAGFREAPVRFLPSYRRVVGSAGRLDGHTLPEAHAGGAGVPMEVLTNGFTTRPKKGGQRTPSYTDRVLTCSLPDLVPQLTVERYACHEALACSDHRPVGADMTLRTWQPSTEARGPSVSWTLRCRLKLGDVKLEYEAPGNGGAPGHGEARGNVSPGAPPAAAAVAPPSTTLEATFPMPAEDPSFSLGRVQWLLGRASASAFARLPLEEAAAAGVVLVAEVDVSATRAVHALVKLVDANGGTLGQGVITVPMPWLSGGGTTTTSTARSRFDTTLVESGQGAGRLRGELTAVWAIAADGAAAQDEGPAFVDPATVV